MNGSTMTLPTPTLDTQDWPWLLTVAIYVYTGGRLWTWLGNILDNEPVRGAIFLGYTLCTFAVFVSLGVAAR